MNGNANGRTWARTWLIVALFVSIVMNVTHAVLADSEITLWLRVPLAILWPVFTFAGIEIVVRVIWEHRWPHSLTRWFLLATSVPAAITSYEHQYTLLGMAGENSLIQAIGPVAIDGLMIGCTMTLLLTRHVIAPPIAATIPEMTEESFEQIVGKLEAEMAANVADIPDEALALNAAFDPSPAPASPVSSPRRRATSGQQESAILLLLEGIKPAAVASQVGAGASTVARWSKVLRTLRENPGAQIDYAKERVSPEFVAYIREQVSK